MALRLMGEAPMLPRIGFFNGLLGLAFQAFQALGEPSERRRSQRQRPPGPVLPKRQSAVKSWTLLAMVVSERSFG
jgi:hypothetical protein